MQIIMYLNSNYVTENRMKLLHVVAQTYLVIHSQVFLEIY